MSQFVVLHGPAGSGKGTVSKALVELQYNLIGAGEEIRQYIATNGLDDPLAARMNERLSHGLNVDTLDLYEVVEKKINNLNGQKILGDGLVREADQALWLVQFSQRSEIVSKFINLIAPFDVIRERLLNRYFVPGNPFPYMSYEAALIDCPANVEPTMRSDDNLEAIQSRFQQYQEKLEPIKSVILKSPNVEYIEINADKSPEEVLVEVALAI
jgi:adenylate kinase family enzyme